MEHGTYQSYQNIWVHECGKKNNPKFVSVQQLQVRY
jgi:hypothetical protein